MLQKILANSDISSNALTSMEKSTQYAESEDFDNFEFEESDDLHEFFED